MAQIQAWAGVAIAAPALALVVTTPLWGRLGDRIGRKWMVVRALVGLALAMAVMAIAYNPLVLVAGRLLQGALGGVVEAAAAFAGSAGSDKNRGPSLGKSFSATAAGALAGPVAGGLSVGAGGLRGLMLAIAAAAPPRVGGVRGTTTRSPRSATPWEAGAAGFVDGDDCGGAFLWRWTKPTSASLRTGTSRSTGWCPGCGLFWLPSWSRPSTPAASDLLIVAISSSTARKSPAGV